MPSPIVTATLQAAALASLSNICAQVISAHRQNLPLLPLSLPELSRFLILTLLTAPLNYHWQVFLERTFPARVESHGSEKSLEMAEQGVLNEKERGNLVSPSEGPQPQLRLSWRNTFLKWFTDCITMGALLNTTAFLVLMGIMKGKTWPEIQLSVRTETIPIILASYRLWPFASVINFTLIPVEKRIVFLNAVGLCWGIYMSMVASTV